MRSTKVCIVVPVYNEEDELANSIETILTTAKKMFENFEIVVGDNASTDATLRIAQKLSKKYDRVKWIHLDEKGRGRALRRIWCQSDADVMCYMDVDLSTDIKHLKELASSIEDGYDIAIGSRLTEGSKTERSFFRETLSRGYVFLLKLFLNIPFSDTQCGFKAVNKKIVKEVLPLVENEEWFFDTELLIIADKFGYKIKEIPVRWKESSDSRVKILSTVTNYIKNILRMKRKLRDMNG